MVAVATDRRQNHPVIIELRELRRALFESEWAFFSRAREIEADEARWRGDFATFDQLLDVGAICQPSRYRNFCRAVEVHGAATVREIGIDAAIALVLASPPPKVVQLAVEHFRTSASTNHVPLSKRQARTVINRLDTREKTSGLVAKVERERTAHEENVILKRRVLALEKENAELKEENAALRERLAAISSEAGARNSTARKPSRNGAKRKGAAATGVNA